MGQVALQLSFAEGDKVLEIGGFNRPLFHPNIDINKVDGVDAVVDVGGERLPFDDGSFDGIYSSFCFEHISHTRIGYLISECYRVLKNGGTMVLITANLLEQCRRVVEHEGDETLGNQVLIFGGQGEEGMEAGSHKSSMTPKLAIRLFADAGFSEVKVLEHPASITDMILEVKK